MMHLSERLLEGIEMDCIPKINFSRDDPLYSKVEALYKQYGSICNDQEKLLSFYNGLDYGFVARNSMYIPGYTAAPPAHTSDDAFLSGRDITAVRHACYLPLFIHDHTFYEITYVADGSCENTVENTSIRMTAGDFLFLPPAAKHMLGVFSNSLVINILVRRTLIEKTFLTSISNDGLLAKFLRNSLYSENTDGYAICRTGADPFCRQMTALLFGEAKAWAERSCDQAAVNKQVCEKLFHALLLYLMESHADHVSAVHSQPMKTTVIPHILLYMENHFKTVTLKELSEVFHYSSDHISKMIKEATGRSFSENRTGLRMRTACTLLKNTDLSVTAVGNAVGYHRIEQFNKIFKKHCGISPSVYRHQNIITQEAPI